MKVCGDCLVSFRWNHGTEWVVFAGPAVPAVGLRRRLDVAVDVEVGGGLGDRRHRHVLVRLPQEASSVVREL